MDWWSRGAALTTGLLFGAAVGWAAGRGQTRRRGQGPAAGRATPPDPAEASREDALRICVDLADRLRDPSPALWHRLNDRLKAIGVEVIMAEGELFDPERHDAVGGETTDDPTLHLTVSRTEFLGYRDAGRWLRRPKVVVYREAS